MKRKYEAKGTRTTTVGRKAVLRHKWLAGLFSLQAMAEAPLENVNKSYTWLLLLITHESHNGATEIRLESRGNWNLI